MIKMPDVKDSVVMRPSIMIATPSYNKMVSHDYALSLADTVALTRASGMSCNSSFMVASSLLCKCRNVILKAFMLSGATHLLCVDSDLGWPAEVLPTLVNEDRDFICGVYPARDVNDPTNIEYMFVPETLDMPDGSESLVTDQRFIKAQYVPAGFMLLKRVVIERLIEKFPERLSVPEDPRLASDEMYVFFNTELYNGTFWGEDYIFCRLVRESGTDIWIDPYITFNHDGRVGRLLDHLQKTSLSNKPQNLNSVEKQIQSSQEVDERTKPIKFNLVRGAA